MISFNAFRDCEHHQAYHSIVDDGCTKTIILNVQNYNALHTFQHTDRGESQKDIG